MFIETGRIVNDTAAQKNNLYLQKRFYCYNKNNYHDMKKMSRIDFARLFAINDCDDINLTTLIGRPARNGTDISSLPDGNIF